MIFIPFFLIIVYIFLSFNEKIPIKVPYKTRIKKKKVHSKDKKIAIKKSERENHFSNSIF